ncbi:MAG: imidazole glycerol phosphate synthase subunit HisH [Bacteroidetes bacterium]|nr:imidazole glycerol phosphate synthase subunit HisH [Bacteroidota bacterium]
MSRVAIIDYGAGNLTSLRYALHRCGISDVVVTSKEKLIRSADRIIFPGVGHARYAMDRLTETGLHKVIPELDQPVLGICLGMQLMCRYSEEGQVEGLGIFSAEVKRFGQPLKVPHMGWNLVKYTENQTYIPEYYYFVHGYYAEVCRETVATCDYGHLFSAVLGRDNFLGCQFHPEKSGPAGEFFLKRFLS